MEVDLEKDYYAILRVPESATREEILRAHRDLMRIIHPDKHSGDPVAEEWTSDANFARDLLTDPIQRAEYDRGRAGRRDRDRGDRTQTHKVRLTPEQGGQGVRISWLHYPRNHAPVPRQIVIPAGVKNGDEFTCPNSVVDGQSLPEVRFLVLVDGPEPGIAPPTPHGATPSPKDPPTPAAPTPSNPSPAPPSPMGKTRSGLRLLGAVTAVGAIGVVAWVLLTGPLGSGAEGGTATGDQPTEAAPTASVSSTATAEDPIVPTVAPPRDDPDADPTVALDTWVADSKPVVRTLPVGAWVPQVSSKCSGLTPVDLRDSAGRLGYPDGSVEDFPSGITETDILNFNLGLAERLDNAMLLVRGTAPPICDGPRLWASLATVIGESRDVIAAWCSDNGFPPGECAPREITDALVEDASYVVHSGSDARYSIEVPWFMGSISVGDVTQFSDSETRATLRILTTRYPVGSSPEQRLREASAQLVPPGTQPTMAEATDSGFVLTGITADGEIYYWRQLGGDAGGLDLIWRYPISARETFDAAVQRSVVSLEIPDD